MPGEQAAGPGSAQRPIARAPLRGANGVSPGEGVLAPAQVRAMFDRIAGVYDTMNTAMTAGLHHRWRARAAQLARVGPGYRVLDVASGTGDLALALARVVAPGGQVVGSDFSQAMLEIARRKATAARTGVEARFELADALALPYAEGSFDAATVAFGARNFSDLACGLREMARVVRPGGSVVVLEITRPTRAPLSLFYGMWFDRLVPLLGRAAGLLASRRARAGGAPTPNGAIAAAYSYLPSSVRRFPGPDELAGEMRAAGLDDVRYELLAGSIIALHVGTVAGGRSA
jgi:demethylmenaquinone methyltransferase / 2-methoxy-6-polyprenyl-1,4-benzoquinol methylase